ncbi:MAG: BT4734/BF3469 family protein [Bacteroidota bacterium]
MTPLQPVTQPMFSFFQPPVTNTLPARTISLATCCEMIKLPYPYLDKTIELRSLGTPEEKRRYKSQHLAFVCFSGIFSRRSEKSLITHSGLITIDLDHIPEPEPLKRDLYYDIELDLAMIFTSPSGNGIKLIASVDLSQGTHAEYFASLSSYLLKHYQIQADPSGKDVSRACFLCHDPHIFINPEYNAW